MSNLPDRDVEAELRLQIMQSRDHAIGAAASVGELRARLARVEAELARVEAELEQKTVRLKNMKISLDTVEHHLRSTTTWKIGSCFMLPVRIFRRLMRGS